MIEIFKYIKGMNKVLEYSISNIKQKSGTQTHNLKLTGGKFKNNVRKYYYPESVVEACNQLPEEVVGQSLVTDFKHNEINICLSSNKNKIKTINNKLKQKQKQTTQKSKGRLDGPLGLFLLFVIFF
uniref:Uncharacterized protein n=1 Tax=Micrurus spixii TaxID=129469 RepID=A0A2D4MP85_9SAUR